MSPNETTGNDEREWAEAMAAAYMAGAQKASSAAPQTKRRHADATDQPGARRAPCELGSTMTVGNSLGAAKNRLSFRTLDTGRAEDYDSWRHAKQKLSPALRTLGAQSSTWLPLSSPRRTQMTRITLRRRATVGSGR